MTAGRCPEQTADACARWLWHGLSQRTPRRLLLAMATDMVRAIQREPADARAILGADPTADHAPAKPARPRRGTVAS